MATEVLMPRQGQSVESCIIIEWKVNEGDVVTTGQPLCEVETDKATFEVEATADGTVLGIFYPADADVDVLKVIAAIGEPGEDISALRPTDGSTETSNTEPEVSKEEVKEAAPVTEKVVVESTGTAGFRKSFTPRQKFSGEKRSRCGIGCWNGTKRSCD